MLKKIAVTLLILSANQHAIADGGIIYFKGSVVNDSCSNYTKNGQINTYCYNNGEKVNSTYDISNGTKLPIDKGIGNVSIKNVDNKDDLLISTIDYN